MLSNDMGVIPNIGTPGDHWVNPPVIVMFNILGPQTYGHLLVIPPFQPPFHPPAAGDGLASTLARVYPGGVKLFCLATYQGMACS